MFTKKKGGGRDNLAEIKGRIIENDFFTPKKEISLILKYLSTMSFKNLYEKNIDVLDACAGKGNLAHGLVMARYNINNLHLVEKNNEYIKEIPQEFLKSYSQDFKVYNDNFFNWYRDFKDSRYDLIISNPPFVPVSRLFTFFRIFLSMLKEDGQLFFICPLFFLNNSDERMKYIFQYIKEIFFLPKMFFGKQQHNTIITANKMVEFNKSYFHFL